MKNSLNQIYLLNRSFDLHKVFQDKAIYKCEEAETGFLYILEMRTSEEKLDKIDVYEIINGNPASSIHIIKDADGKMIVDYYPQQEEYVIIDDRERICKITLSAYFDSCDLETYTLELILKRVNHKKKKELIKIPASDCFKTKYDTSKSNRFYHIQCDSVETIENILEYLPLEVAGIEEKLKQGPLATIPNLESPKEIVYPIKETDIPTIYIYDRTYHIVGWYENACIYRNCEDDIQDVVITFSETKDKILSMKLVRYVSSVVDDIDIKVKQMMIMMTPQELGMVRTSIVTYDQEYALVESRDLENELREKNLEVDLRNARVLNLKGDMVVTTDFKIESFHLQIDIQNLGTLYLKQDRNGRNEFLDDKNYQYRVSMQACAYYKSISQSSAAIIRNLEKNLIPQTETSHKVLSKSK